MYYEKIEWDDKSDDTIDHSAFIYLRRRDGRYLGFFPSTRSAGSIAQTIQSWLAAERQRATSRWLREQRAKLSAENETAKAISQEHGGKPRQASLQMVAGQTKASGCKSSRVSQIGLVPGHGRVVA